MGDRDREYFLVIDGRETYARTADRREKYPQNGRRFALVEGRHVYARDAHDNEIYPETSPRFIRDENGMLRYAVSNTGEIVFPKDELGNEMYIRDEAIQSELLFLDAATSRKRYARRRDNSEIYPTHPFGDGEIEYTLFESYALDRDAQPVYPLDENGNEYLDYRVKKGPKPVEYPITNDNFYIVPGGPDGQPNFCLRRPPLDVSHIVGVIEQLDAISFKTNVKSKRMSRGKRKDYETTISHSPKKSKNSSVNTILWILAVLCALVLTFYTFA